MQQGQAHLRALQARIVLLYQGEEAPQLVHAQQPLVESKTWQAGSQQAPGATALGLKQCIKPVGQQATLQWDSH